MVKKLEKEVGNNLENLSGKQPYELKPLVKEEGSSKYAGLMSLGEETYNSGTGAKYWM